MLTKKQVEEIREHLERAQNPVFFFDNDPDGLCSFLLLQRFIERGKGVAVKSFPDLDASYFRKVNELNADYIFILDKAVISEEFWEKVGQVNIPVVWIDHHKTQGKIPDFVNYYNPLLNKETVQEILSKHKMGEPVTYICYKITQKKEDLWLATLGCISDRFLPDFYPEFKKKYPDLIIDSENVFDIAFKSKLGKLADLLDLALKDRTTNVVNMMKYLRVVKTPYEIFEENTKNYSMHKRYKEVSSKYKKILNKAILLGNKSGKILFFQYGGDLSLSSNLSNELSYLFPEKILVVAYLSGAKVSLSIRGEKIRDLLLESIKDLKNSSGGGHENACGATVQMEDLEKFKENLELIVENRNV